jgi:hypothetical protein
MRGLDARTGELFSYVDLEDRVPAQHRSRRIINPTTFFPCRAAWRPFAEHPVRLAAAAGAAEENLEHGHASRAVCGPGIGSHPIMYSVAAVSPSAVTVCPLHPARIPPATGRGWPKPR